MNRTTPRPRKAPKASIALSLAIAATLLAPSLSACVFAPATGTNAEQQAEQVIETPEVETTPEPGETETEKPEEPAPEPEPVALSSEDKFLEEAQDAITLPFMTDEMERLMLEVGYSACDIYAEGIDKDFIILVMEEAIAPYSDVYTPRAATIITNAALTHLC